MHVLFERTFIGYLVSKDGVKTDPSIVATVRDFAPPTNVRGVRTFLGLTGFYRKFIPNYAGIALPLTDLLRNDAVFPGLKTASQRSMSWSGG